mmetsp:Transcript_18620/g.46284  ORF Transcript_18620/g.46284 Transcript_18620/m.46284 type:complete len:238 (+) Transcript_18620:642-1355(+)
MSAIASPWSSISATASVRLRRVATLTSTCVTLGRESSSCAFSSPICNCSSVGSIDSGYHPTASKAWMVACSASTGSAGRYDLLRPSCRFPFEWEPRSTRLRRLRAWSLELCARSAAISPPRATKVNLPSADFAAAARSASASLSSSSSSTLSTSSLSADTWFLSKMRRTWSKLCTTPPKVMRMPRHRFSRSSVDSIAGFSSVWMPDANLSFIRFIFSSDSSSCRDNERLLNAMRMSL